MASVNKVILVGNLGRDPELRYTKSGQPVASFSIATTDSWNNKAGEREEHTEWHRIVVWGKAAENCGKYLSKGRSVYIEGRLQTRKWEDKDGHERQTTEINAQTVQFLGGGRGGESHASGSDSDTGGYSSRSEQAPPPPDDDIPF